jgi:hypothetical protein
MIQRRALNMPKEKTRVKIPRPKIRKDWGGLKPYTRVHGPVKYDRGDEKVKSEEDLKKELEDLEKEEKLKVKK